MLLRGGWVFDGTGTPPGEADVLVEDGRIVEVGPGLDGDEAVGRAVAAGVKVAMGTDSGVTPHGRNLAELELMAKGGMTPAQVLAATTSSAAELLGLSDELGTLEPGKRADVVVVDGDPFELATLGDRIAAVVKDGRLVAGNL
jgi:imidazolonepropionase-like amidohydrolase